MAALFFVLLIVAAWDVTKTAVKAQHADYQASRPAKKPAKKPGKSGKGGGAGPKTVGTRQPSRARHAAGYWSREAMNGFPVARTGWHAGWLAHKTARNQQRSIREQARTTHLQGLAEHLRVIREQRELQRQANEEIQTAIKTADQPPKGRKEVREAVGKVLPFPVPKPAAAAPLPSETVGKPQPGPYATRRADGKPETEADKRFFAERESGYTGPLNQDGRRPDMNNPQEREAAETLGRMRERAENSPGPDAASWSPDDWPTDVPHRRNGDAPSPTANGGRSVTTTRRLDGEPETPANKEFYDGIESDAAHDAAVAREASRSAAPSRKGSSVTDITYDTVLTGSKAASAQADEDTATIQKRMDEAYARADELTAANVDPSVIDHQMSYADSLKRAVDALSDGGEHAGSTADQLQRYHGQMDEAVKSAPGKVADREFHEG
jgi:hypothetical protein